jgi:hypothetical protein
VPAAAILEATAVLRASGSWSVCLGPESALQRFVRRASRDRAQECQLGLLASCVGAIAMSSLDQRSIRHQVIRVVVRRGPGVNISIRVCIECEIDQRAAEECLQSVIQRDPLFALLTQADRVAWQFETYSSIAIRIP